MKPLPVTPVHLPILVNAETLLRAHPGVREAVVVSWPSTPSSEEMLVGYVVPDEDYISRVFGGSEEEHKRVQKWRKTFDLSQFGKQSELSEPDFNIAGWNSSYTRQPIPAEHMREWVELTVQELLAFHPQEILEIGCGTGLLLLRLARGCARYCGADVSSAVLKKLKKQMDELAGDWSNITLMERSADNLEGFAENSFDTSIMNSVVKYFPSLSYLMGVLEGLLRVTMPGGRIFIGDVRNLALLEPYAVSIELYQAEPSMSVGELRERAQRRIQFEEQLVLSPAFFLALQEQYPRITRVEVHPKLGRFDNEMNRFRFNAILHVNAECEQALNLSFLDCAELELTSESIAALLQKQPEALAVKNIINARVESDVEACAKLLVANPSDTVGEFRKILEASEPRGIAPQTILSLGEKLGYCVAISWAASRPDGSYDVVFRKTVKEVAPLPPCIVWPKTQLDTKNLALLANVPGCGVFREKLIMQLREYAQQNLPGQSAPIHLRMVNTLPKTSDGTVDISELPDPRILPA